MIAMNTPPQLWIFSVRYAGDDTPKGEVDRRAVVGPARSSTVEAGLHLVAMSEPERDEVRAHLTIRQFVEGLLDPTKSGYIVENPQSRWWICLGSVHAVIAKDCPVCDGPHDDARHRAVRKRGG